MHIVSKLILAPLAGVLYLCIATVLLPAWLLGFIPVVGVWIFTGGVYLASPFFVILKYLGFSVESFGSEQFIFQDDGLYIIKGINKRYFPISAITEIREQASPPFIVIAILRSDGLLVELNPLADTDKLIDWALERGIAVIRWQGDPLHSPKAEQGGPGQPPTRSEFE